jgi:hypothetical protein
MRSLARIVAGSFVGMLLTGAAGAQSAEPPDTRAVLNEQRNDPEVLTALPRVGPEMGATEWLGRRAVAPWIDELPPPRRVFARIGGNTPAEAALRQRDAFDALISVVHALGPSIPKEIDRCLPREELARYVILKKWLDAKGLYTAAQATAPTAGVTARRKAVRDEVLAAFFSERTRALYRATPEAEALSHAREVAAHSEELAPIVAQDKLSQSERTVFGIPLGEPLRLPPCQSRQATTTCIDPVGDLGTFMQLLRANAQEDPYEVKVGTEIKVRLADQACPDWVRSGSCTILMTVDGGYPIAARFWTRDRGGELLIKKKLEEKYHRPGRSLGVSECSNSRTGVVVARATTWGWTLEDSLYVSYAPMGGADCQRGLIRIETGAYRRLRDGAGKHREATEPKL